MAPRTKLKAPPTQPNMADLAASMVALVKKPVKELQAYLDEQLGAGTHRLYPQRERLLKACQEQLAQEMAVQAARHAFTQGQLSEERRVRLGLPKEVEDAIPDLTFKLEEGLGDDVPVSQKALEETARGLVIEGVSHTVGARRLVSMFHIQPDSAEVQMKQARDWLWARSRRLTLSGESIRTPALLD